MTVVCFAIGPEEIALGADSRTFVDGSAWSDTAEKLAMADGGILAVAGSAWVAADPLHERSPPCAAAGADAGESDGPGAWVEWIHLAERILWDPVPVPPRIRWELVDERILEICQRALEIEKYEDGGARCPDLHDGRPCAVTPLAAEQERRTLLTTGWVDPEGVCWLQQTWASVVDDSAFVDGMWMRGTTSGPTLFANGPDQEATQLLNEWIASEPYLLELLELPGGAAEVAEEVIRASFDLLADHCFAPGGRAHSVSLRSPCRR